MPAWEDTRINDVVQCNECKAVYQYRKSLKSNLLPISWHRLTDEEAAMVLDNVNRYNDPYPNL